MQPSSLLRWLLLAALGLLIIGCGGQAAAPATSTPEEAVANASPTDEPPTEPATAVPTDTAEPSATPTDIPEPATFTPVPTSTNLPPTSPTSEATAETTPETTATSQPATAEATEPTAEPEETPAEAEPTQASAPPPSGSVTQPPYAESACSDKYPCNNDVAAWESRIQVPGGYTATYFAWFENLNPTGLAFGPDGNLYVATQQGIIYTVNSAGQTSPYVSGLVAPTGMAFRPGTSQLFVSSRVVEDNLNGEGQLAVIEGGGVRQLIGGLPCCYAFMHGPHDIVFDAAGNGYLGVGARADHGEILGQPDVQDTLHPYEASILRFNPDSGSVEKYADGLRNPYGLAIDANGTIFATDNGPDFGPPDEFHRITPGGQHGYPWYDCDVCFTPPEGTTVIPPLYNFPAHSSPTGATAYLGSQFPGAYNNIFVTLWSAFPGAQKVMRFGPGGVGASNFAMGFAAPIDVTTDPAGNLYVADWATGIIFKISYTG